MLKLSDEDFEKLGLTAGARKKIRVNLEVLRYIYKLSAAMNELVLCGLPMCN